MPSATLDPARVRAVLLWAVAAFTVLTLAALVARELTPGSVTANALYFFDASVEQTVPTLFSVLVLLACGGFSAAIASRAAAAHARRWLLAVLFVCLALDESVSIHEATVRPLRRLLDAGGVLYYTWVIPGALLAALLVPVFRAILADMSRRRRRLFAAAAATFFGSALGFELVEGWLSDRYGETDARLIPFVTAEEALEMTAAVLLLYALMDHLAPWEGTLRLRGHGGSSSGPTNPR